MKATTQVGTKILGAVAVLMCMMMFSAPAHAEPNASPKVVNFGTVTMGGSKTMSVTITNDSRYRSVYFSGASVTSSRFSYNGPARFSLRPRQSMRVSVSFRPNAKQMADGMLILKQTDGDRIAVSLFGTGNSATQPTPKPTTPAPTTPKPTTPAPTTPAPAPTVPAPTVPAPTVPAPTVPAPTVPAPTVPAPTTPAPTVPAAIAPSITSQPVNRTVTAGQTTSFSVSISGTAPFTYQWTRNGAAINGATSSTYNTPATVSSDNNAKFAVIVSNAAGSATSNQATLTVNVITLTLSLNPGSLNFGSVNIDSSATQQATLTNSGSGNVTLSGMSVSGAGFSASGASSGQILTPGQNVTINVTFRPAASGSVSGSINVTSNASAVALNLSGSGAQLVSRTVSLSWIRSTSTVNGYMVYSSQVAGGPYTKLTASAVSVPSYTDSSVQNGTTYYYVVTSLDSKGTESAYSNQASAIVQ